MSFNTPSTIGPSVDEATLSFVRSVIKTSVGGTTPHPSLNVAINTFCTAFQRWNPKQFLDITSRDKSVFDFLFSTSTVILLSANSIAPTSGSFPFGGGTFHSISLSQAQISQCRQSIHHIVHDWMQKWSQNSLTEENLRSTMELMQTDTWDTYQDFHENPDQSAFRAHVATFCQHIRNNNAYFYYNKNGRDFLLPTKEEIECKIDEISQMEERIEEYLRVEIHGHTYQLNDILQKYKKLNGCLYNTQPEHETMTLNYLQRLKGIFGPKPDVIYHLSYFDLYPSILFNDVTSVVDKSEMMYKRQISTIKDALSRIEQAIGTDMTYDGVVYALNLLNTKELLNAELQIILANDILQLTSIDVTNFRAVQLLHNISKPLQGFIQACVQYKFQVVNDDPTFQMLKTEVQTFYGNTTESKDRQTCVTFINRLYDFLYFHQPFNDADNYSQDHPHLSLLHKIKELTKVMTLLTPLSYVSNGPKLWQYMVDMKWFQHGTKFDQDYHTLSKTLNNYDAVPEALIVETLGPVVRCFITIEKLKRCPRIEHLLIQGWDVYEIYKIQQATPTLQQDIYKVNSCCKSIQELFQIINHIPTNSNITNPTTVPSTTVPSTTVS